MLTELEEWLLRDELPLELVVTLGDELVLSELLLDENVLLDDVELSVRELELVETVWLVLTELDVELDRLELLDQSSNQSPTKSAVSSSTIAVYIHPSPALRSLNARTTRTCPRHGPLSGITASPSRRPTSRLNSTLCVTRRCRRSISLTSTADAFWTQHGSSGM